MANTAWLIEKENTTLCLGIEECYRQKWTINSLALRFARKQDAEAYVKTHLEESKRVGVIIVEHEWIDSNADKLKCPNCEWVLNEGSL